MKKILMMGLMAWAALVSAEYTEVMKSGGLTENLVKDYGMVDDNAQSNQSAKLQQAIDEVSSRGGGKLILPKGTCSFTGIRFKSDVHLLIEKDTVIKPRWPAGTKTLVFAMDGDDEKIENVSQFVELAAPLLSIIQIAAVSRVKGAGVSTAGRFKTF